MKKCCVCGKEIDILWPEQWVYKRGNGPYPSHWMCSWSCLQKYDKGEGKENKMAQMRNSTKETALLLLDVIEHGKDPMEWLRERGYTNPEKAYQNIKARIQGRDPEIAARFPKRRAGRKAAAKQAEQLPEETTVELVYDPEIAEEYRREQRQKEADREARTLAEHPMPNVKEKPAENALEKYLKRKAEEKAAKEQEELKLQPGGNYRLSVEETPETKKHLWRTAAVRNEILGVFYYDEKHNSVDWRHPMGEEISLPPADWNLLAQSLGQIMHVLGVDNQEMEV